MRVESCSFRSLYSLFCGRHPKKEESNTVSKIQPKKKKYNQSFKVLFLKGFSSCKGPGSCHCMEGSCHVEAKKSEGKIAHL